MIYSSAIRVLQFLKTLVQGLEPFAKKKDIKLNVTANENEIIFDHSESELHCGFTKLISSIIDYMPNHNTLDINASVIENASTKYLLVKIRNTGINLKMVTAITKISNLPVTLFSSEPGETTFEVCYSLEPSVKMPVSVSGTEINYTSFVKGIQTHYAKLNDPIARLSGTKPKEAAFLTRIIKCILDNIGDERFDANALSNAMAMSRAQLLRRLKSLTGNSPGFYIKTMRLEKAKEFLQTTELSVSEVSFKTGFGTPSNFSKVFTEKYGITPSQFRRINQNATNK